MAYAAVQDLIDRFGEREIALLTDRASGTAVVTAIAQKALDDAEAFLNGLISRRVVTPVSPVPGLLKRLTLDVARYYLHEDHAPERVKWAYDEARKFAEAVARGDAVLGDAAAPTPAPEADLPLTEGPASVFGRERTAAY